MDKNVHKKVEKPPSGPTGGDPESRSPGRGPWEGTVREGLREVPGRADRGFARPGTTTAGRLSQRWNRVPSDEMCLVASHGLFRGWGPAELTDHGVVLSLFGCTSLAMLVHRVLEADGVRPAKVVLLARRPTARDTDDDDIADCRRTLVRAMGVA